MSDIRIYSVSDRYIQYLRQDPKLSNVFDSKEDVRLHTRKYLGAVFSHESFYYFAPFSSPKNSDYIIDSDGTKAIRKSIIPIIRMTTTDTRSGNVELKGTLKLSNMIPVPSGELTPYNISEEIDAGYRQVVWKEWDFIRSNIPLIMKNARTLYNQKTNYDILYVGKKAPGYLASTVDFRYAEQKCREFEISYAAFEAEATLVTV